MPFPPPTIRIRLTGLLAFRFTGGVCRIGVFDDSPDHKLRVNVYRAPTTRPGRIKENLVLELFQKIQGEDISLTVTDPAPTASGIILAPQSSGPFSTPAGNELGFDLIPDIEGPDFHNTSLPGAFTQFIQINNGVFYTLTTKPGWILREKGPIGHEPDAITRFKPMMGIEAGINIYLQDPATSQAVLRYPDATGTFIEVPFRKETDVIHELEMVNDCPIDVARSPGMFESDFSLYYSKLATTVAEEDRFRIVFYDDATGALSIDHPCGPIKGG